LDYSSNLNMSHSSSTITSFPRIVIAGERSGVGKSTITVGILAALQARGLDPQPFKVGPDFLDPMHHDQVSVRRSRNLDTYFFQDCVREAFARNAAGAGISVIEGVMGLYDGMDGVSEIGSTAHLAKQLDAPVLLIVDAEATSRSAGAIAYGFQTYDPSVNVAGVIFNRVAGARHLEMLKASLRGVPCLGGLPREESIVLESRHLGLIPATELPAGERYEVMRRTVEECLDMDLLLELARKAPPMPAAAPRKTLPTTARIGIAKDAAFNFYYEDNLEILRSQGAELVFFSPLRDRMPEVDGLYFGGGYPELFGEQLAGNASFINDVHEAVERGMPIYAECGGMMYLCKEMIDLEGRSHPMAHVFEARTEMTRSLQALGYVEATATKDNFLAKAGEKGRGHVFHYSRVVGGEDMAFMLDREKGISGHGDMMLRNNCLAGYVHLHFDSCPGFARNFVAQATIFRARAGGR
jgi:cobyrinic acid a,c-diamide synthase